MGWAGHAREVAPPDVRRPLRALTLPDMPVEYPRCLSKEATVSSVGGSPVACDGAVMTRHGSWLAVMPYRRGNRPVCSAALLGVQMGAALIHCVSLIPSSRIASMCGVEWFPDPKQPRSANPRSSTRNTRNEGSAA